MLSTFLFYDKIFFIHLNLLGFFFKYSSKFLEIEDSSFMLTREEYFNDKYHKVVFLKLIINTLQIMGWIKGLNLEWSNTINKFFFAFSKISDLSEQLFSFDCVMSSSTNSVDLFYLKLLLVFFLPFMCSLVILIYFLIIKWVLKKIINNFLICSLCITFFLIQPIILQKTFMVFSCKQIDSNQYFISSSLINECFTDEYYQYVINFILFIFMYFSLSQSRSLQYYYGF